MRFTRDEAAAWESPRVRSTGESLNVKSVTAMQRDGWSFIVRDAAGSADVSAYGLVIDAAAQVTRASEGSPRGAQWLPTDKGWVGKLEDVTDAGRGVAWLESFARIWGETAWIEPRPRTRGTGRRDPRPTLSLGMAFAGDLSAVKREDRGRLWTVPTDTTRQLAKRALAWVDLDGATRYYHHSRNAHIWQTPVIASPVVDTLVEAIVEPYCCLGLKSTRSRPLRHRSVFFEREGRVACQDVDPTRTTGEQLDELVSCIRWLPAALDYAFVAFDHGGLWNTWMNDYMFHHLPNGLLEGHVRGHRRLWSSYAPDAFGVQVLTDAHLERAHDLSAWAVEELAPGRHLVTARDLEPWLATPPPHPDNQYRLSAPPAEVLQQARADFGAMLPNVDLLDRLDPR